MNFSNKKILLIGTKCNLKKRRFTGQSVMFDGIVNALGSICTISVLDISSHFSSKNTFYRALDYILILLKLIFLCIFNKYNLVYLVTSQSRRGFYRDYCMISICKLFNIKVLTHQYGANYNQMLDVLSKKERINLIKLLDYVSTIIVEGEYMKKQFSFYDKYIEKVKVIPNGLPIEGKNILSPKSYDQGSPFTLLYLSNLIYSKGYFDVVKAVDILVNKENADVKCIFVGQFMKSSDDPSYNHDYKKEFEDFIVEHKLESRIKYFTGLYGDEKDKVFSEANVFVLPTYYINEGQPVSIIEAMSYGCVPLVTEYRHIPMMVTCENGCFLQPRSPETIVDAVKTLMGNSNLYYLKSKRAIEDYKSKFRFEMYVTKVLKEVELIIDSSYKIK